MPKPEFLDPPQTRDAPSRRTILAGAAWSVPAIAMVSAAPAVAATADVSLAFDRPAYTGDPCSTIDGMVVTATRSGAAAPGVVVTVSLSGTYSFEGGTSTSTSTTDANGKVTLPKIRVPSGAGSATATATAPTANAQSVGLSASSNYGRYLVGDATSITSVTSYAVPSSATPIACNGMFFDQNAGALYYGGAVIATGVTSVAGNRNASTDYFSYMQNGVAKSAVGSNGTVQSTNTWPQVPSVAIAVTYGTFFNRTNGETGDIWYWDQVVKTGVNRVAGRSGSPTNRDPKQWWDWISYFDGKGGWLSRYIAGQFVDSRGPAPSVPASAVSTGYPLLLQAGNTQWYRNQATNGIPASAGSQNGVLDSNNGTLTTEWLSGVFNGTPRTVQRFDGQSGSTPTNFPSIPSSATPVGPKGIFLDQGNLWYIDKIVDVNVSSAVGDSLPDGSPRVTVVKSC